jgi:hypothetical protein
MWFKPRGLDKLLTIAAPDTVKNWDAFVKQWSQTAGTGREAEARIGDEEGHLPLVLQD